MKFNWYSENEFDEKLKKLCIDLEYKLRPKITHFLMTHLEQECYGDFSCFYFDVDLENLHVSIARPTPLKLKRKIAKDFNQEINQNFISALIPVLKAGFKVCSFKFVGFIYYKRQTADGRRRTLLPP